MPEANKVKRPIQTDKISLSGNKYIPTHPVIFFFFYNIYLLLMYTMLPEAYTNLFKIIFIYERESAERTWRG